MVAVTTIVGQLGTRSSRWQRLPLPAPARPPPMSGRTWSALGQKFASEDRLRHVRFAPRSGRTVRPRLTESSCQQQKDW